MTPADWVIIAGIVLIAIADVALVYRGTSTISRRLRFVGYRVAFAPYAWGVFGGHFWGPPIGPLGDSWWLSIGLLFGGGLGLSAIHWGAQKWIDVPNWFVLTYLLCGVPAGMFLWPQ